MSKRSVLLTLPINKTKSPSASRIVSEISSLIQYKTRKVAIPALCSDPASKAYLRECFRKPSDAKEGVRELQGCIMDAVVYKKTSGTLPKFLEAYFSDLSRYLV